MDRFFVPAELNPGREVALPPETAHQLFRVLRLSVGARLVVFSGDGREYEAELTSKSPALARLLVTREPRVELPCRLHVAVAALKGEKLDWVVQKLTELGVAAITLLQTERTIVQTGSERWERRLLRLERIACEAAEQCGRVRLPRLAGPRTLVQALDQRENGAAFFLDPTADGALGRLLVPCPPGLTLLIGPEGGFTPRELEQARELGAVPARLGWRVLRAETAAVTAAGIAADAAENGPPLTP